MVVEKWKCFVCKKLRNLKYFHSNKRNKNGKSHQCKFCIKNYHLMKWYAVTLEWFTNKSKNGCELCGTKPKYRSLDVDHIHKTGLARGVLCVSCNRNIIGQIESRGIDPQVLFDYLMRDGEQVVTPLQINKEHSFRVSEGARKSWATGRSN